MKKILRGRQFANKEDLRAAVVSFLEEKPPEFFKNAFKELAVRWEKCVGAHGNYFEK